VQHILLQKIKKMKTTQMKFKGIPGMVCLGFVVGLFFLLAVSCRKNSAGPASTVTLQTIADKLEGEILNGSVSTESDEEGTALWCNEGKTLIVLAKIPSQGFTDPGKIEHAQVVYSSFGIIIRNTATNQLWYYIQNDEKSQKRFESLQSAGESPVVSGILETIRLNLSQSS